MIDKLSSLQIMVINGIWFEHPLKVIKLRAMIVIVYPSWLRQGLSDVLILWVEDEDFVVGVLLLAGVELARGGLFYDVAFVADYVFWGVNGTDYCFRGLGELEVGFVYAVLLCWLGVEIFDGLLAWRGFFLLLFAKLDCLLHFLEEFGVGVIVCLVWWLVLADDLPCFFLRRFHG